MIWVVCECPAMVSQAIIAPKSIRLEETMEEHEFNPLADAMLAKIEAALENCDADIDFELKAGGVLEVTCENGSKLIINRHTAAREIWLAARSGGYHFKHADGDWIGTRDGEPLMKVISRCLSEQTGEQVLLTA